MPLDGIKNGAEQILSIIAADSLERLAIIFRGQKVPKMEKVHQASVGSKKLKDNCVSVEYAKDGLIVANFKSITGITDEGWTDFIITKKDKRFNISSLT